MEEGRRLGIVATPAFFISSRRFDQTGHTHSRRAPIRRVRDRRKGTASQAARAALIRASRGPASLGHGGKDGAFR